MVCDRSVSAQMPDRYGSAESSSVPESLRWMSADQVQGPEKAVDDGADQTQTDVINTEVMQAGAAEWSLFKKRGYRDVWSRC